MALDREEWFDKARQEPWDSPDIAELMQAHDAEVAYDRVHPRSYEDFVYRTPMTPERTALRLRARAAVRRAAKAAVDLLAVHDAPLETTGTHGARYGVAREFAARVKGVLSVTGVAVFGSVAKGRDGQASDIDLYVRCGGLSNSVRVQRRLLWYLRERLGGDPLVEVVDQAPIIWRWQGERLHVLLGTHGPVGRGHDGVHEWFWKVDDMGVAVEEHGRAPGVLTGQVGGLPVVATPPATGARRRDWSDAVAELLLPPGKVRVVGYNCGQFEGEWHISSLGFASSEVHLERAFRQWVQGELAERPAGNDDQ